MEIDEGFLGRELHVAAEGLGEEVRPLQVLVLVRLGLRLDNWRLACFRHLGIYLALCVRSVSAELSFDLPGMVGAKLQIVAFLRIAESRILTQRAGTLLCITLSTHKKG